MFKVLRHDFNSPLKKNESPTRLGSPNKKVETVNSEQPMRGFFTIMCIQPTNIYKKIMAQSSDKTLDRQTCHMLNAYFSVKNHKLFDCKTSISIKVLPQQDLIKDSQDSLIELNMQLSTLKNFRDNLKKINERKGKEFQFEDMQEP
jgi:predicted transcriptional regulator